MSLFRVRPAPSQPGYYEIVARVDVTTPKYGVLYRAGEVVPSSKVDSKADAETWVADLNKRYATLESQK